MEPKTTTVSRAGAAQAARAAAIPVFFAALLGVFLIWGVGFSHSSVLHNAGHDTRHSNAFPCH
jgi:cobalt transporter subunit CbtB